MIKQMQLTTEHKLLLRQENGSIIYTFSLDTQDLKELQLLIMKALKNVKGGEE